MRFGEVRRGEPAAHDARAEVPADRHDWIAAVLRTTGGPQNSGDPIVSISRYFSSGVVSGWLTPPYFTEPHAVRASTSTATVKRRTELRRHRAEKVPGSR